MTMIVILLTCGEENEKLIKQEWPSVHQSMASQSHGSRSSLPVDRVTIKLQSKLNIAQDLYLLLWPCLQVGGRPHAQI